MHIVILGAGELGCHLAKALANEEFSVTVIDKDPKKLEALSKEADIATLIAPGTKWKALSDLIEHNPSFFIALTGNDESNLVSCTIAKNLGFPQTIARVKEIGFLSRSRLDFGRLFFVDHFIGTEVITAHDILKSLLNHEDLAVENFAHGTIQMRTFLIPESWPHGKTFLKDLDLPKEIIISLIRRKNPSGKDQIIFPHGEDRLLPKDEVTIIGESQTMYQIHTFFASAEKPIKSVIIVGGTPVALRLAFILEKLDIHVKIIERDLDRCQELADLLPESTILHHDGQDQNFLHSEGVQNAGAFIACTNEDESNLLLALLGKKCGCSKVLALISDVNLAPVLRDLDITVSISEKVNLTNRILSLVHGKKIISIASLCENQAKVLEMKVSAESELVGIPLSDISSRLPKDLLIAAIENRGRIMIGKGTRILSPNDTIIVITSAERVHELSDLF
jgi:trk system potassium uptake protein